jgi:hypothetical protein
MTLNFRYVKNVAVSIKRVTLECADIWYSG